MKSSKPAEKSPQTAFLTEFRRLKNWIDDDPSELISASFQDESILIQCQNVRRAELILKRAHGISDTEMPLDSVNQFLTAEFIEQWRDYETRYQADVEKIVLAKVFDFTEDQLAAIRTSSTWEKSNQHGEDRVHYLDYAIKAARWVASTNGAGQWELDDLVQVDDGIDFWDKSRKGILDDLQGMFRRRRLLPQVLASAKLANPQINPLIHNALSNLADAQRAFVFGAYHAALAMLRSTIEAVLQEGYNAVGEDLSQQINSVRGRLPRDANADKLHTIRKRANLILHIAENRSPVERESLELATLEDLATLQRLIEGIGKR